MITVITGDIIGSRKLIDQEKWISPLKELFTTWSESPNLWKIDRGDFFQIEIAQSEEALKKAFQIKALVKSVAPLGTHKTKSAIDVRLGIGIGDKTYSAESISESNGPAFIYSGEKFDQLKKEHITMGLKTNWPDFDEEMNLYLKLAGIFMDKWSVSSAELMRIALNNPDIKQEDIGKQLGIKQNSVSGRWNRAKGNETLEVEKIFRKKIKQLDI